MKVISLINMKGGVGKTTLSTNICDCLARRNKKKVLLRASLKTNVDINI